jgi:ABC-2 type transport system permease protein
MSKTFLIIKREYLSRVKKKSFLLMTFLVPMLIIGMYALVIALSISGGDNVPTVEVIDDSGLLGKSLKNKNLWNRRNSG